MFLYDFVGEGAEFIQPVRSLHPVGLADIGLYFVQYILLLSTEYNAGKQDSCRNGY